MAISSEATIILKILFFFGFFAGLILLGMPENYLPISTFNFLAFGGKMAFIVATCSIFSGVGCALGLLTTFLADIGIYYFATTNLISYMLLIPLQYVTGYIMYRLARGGG
jgi:hypothetical protein